MAGLVKLDKFAPSQTPYALHPGTFRVDKYGFARVEAFWAGRKNGRTTASVGHLTAYECSSFAEFVESIDMRYGGTWRAKWDGETLITSNPVRSDEHARLTSLLDGVLYNFPGVFPNYEGWYYRNG